MSARGILTLGILTLIALTLALILARPGNIGDVVESQALVPGLREMINDIDTIDLVAADGAAVASLRRERERWRVQEKDGYEADFGLVHDLLRDLASGRRIEPRTSNPEWYGRLGVADISDEGGSGLLLRFPGSELPSLHVGVLDSTETGRFVRLEGEAQAWLSDRRLDLPTSALRWLERAVMDIPASELREVTLRHADGDTVRLRAASEDGEDWVLMNVPDGRDAAPMWQLRPVANGLANLNLEGVRRHQMIPDEAVRALYVTRDGLNFVASLFEDGDGRWVHFTVSAELSASAVPGEGDDEELPEIVTDATAVDARLSPWQFRVSERKYDNMTRRLEELLIPEEA
ncbi:MAG: DUF4340 domain-containing protein [Wenzhouxiangella sp.]|nr:MAG: DUF4340 domain-containing protein [Wenzhouxiangella sp.]